MLRIRRLLAVLALASLGCLPSFAARLDRSKLQPCKVPDREKKEVDALCAAYEVWENREAKAGRKIGLRVVVLPALSSNPLPDPVFDLAGGPGEAATRGAGYAADNPLRQERDLVFVDQRGSGEPDRLGCALVAPEDGLQGYLGEIYPLEGVRRCRDELGKKYDLTRYSVAAAVDDFDEVRAWLGYGKVNLSGGSYGTRTAQVWLQRHPGSVRAAILWDVVPMDEPVALSHAAGAQRSIDLLFARCEKDAACHAKLPGVRQDFQAVMDRLSQGPVEVEVAHPETGKATRVRLSREVVADGIRLTLYSAKAAAALPLFFHQAAAGDWKPLGQTVVAAKAEIAQMITPGLFFSVTCSEDIPFIDPAEVPARTAGSFFGDYRVRRQTAACALWPHARIDPAQREAIHSDVPVLVISGDLDPVTPPDFGRRASRFLTQGLHLVEPFASHEDSPQCVIDLVYEVIRRGTTQGLDTSCVARLEPVPFLLEVPKETIRPFGGDQAQEPPHPSRAKLAPCKVPGGEKEVDALCGTYEVWENREAKAGRKIGLRVVVLPALSAHPLPDPVFDLAGGPGQASTGSAGYLAEDPMRQERDLVFVDQRGTGEPGRLGCTLAAPEDGLQGRLGEMFPEDAVRRCRDELAKSADLTRYTTAASVDDFDEVRGWLGYPKVNLWGTSYGTRTAQVWLRRHPESVRTAILWSAMPMDEPISISIPEGVQRSLDLVLGNCEKDAACHAKLPRVREDFQAVLDRLSQGPVEVEVAHPDTGEPTRVRLSRELVADGIRLLLYTARTGAALPLFFHQAAVGDWKPLGQAVVAAKGGIARVLALGMAFSVLCSEDIPFIDPAEVPARTAGSFLGDYRLRRQTAACALWPRARIDPAEREAIHSDLPVLVVNGDLDPVTPPDFGPRISRFLTQVLRVVEPYASHGDTPQCVIGLAYEVIRRGTTQGLDTSCVAKLEPVPFLLEVPKGEVNPFG